MTETVHLAVYDTLADWEPGYAVAPGRDADACRRRMLATSIATISRPTAIAR